MAKKRYELIIFDFDNTLYEGKRFAMRLVLKNLTKIMWAKAEREARKLLAGKECQSQQGLRSELYGMISAKVGISADKVEKWYTERYLPSMVSILKSHYKARPWASETIDALLDSGISVAVLSDYALTRERLDAVGLTQEDVGTYSSEEMGAFKPAARPFLTLAFEAAVSPERCLVIGDRADTDGEGALAAGMDCILLEGKKAINDKGLRTLSWKAIVDELMAMTKA